MSASRATRQLLEKAAARWHSFHCDQLKPGSRCGECTRLYKAIAAFKKATKK